MKQKLLFKAGETVYFAGQKGPAYRVTKGNIRLDHTDEEGEISFASMAIQEDLLGAEVLLGHSYQFNAHALVDTEIEVWQEPSELWEIALAKELLKSNQRNAEVISLRCGQAIDRIIKLIKLMVPGYQQAANEQLAINISLPALREAAEMTGLTIETVSRCLTSLRKQGFLQPIPGARGNIRNQFVLNLNNVEALAA